jgi:DNA-binding GntR family transcriptional regulator
VERRANELDAACAAPRPDRPAIDAAHAALHHALVAAAGSDRITAAHAQLAAEGRLVLLQSRAALPVTRMAEAHRELLTRLRSEGPQALREHLDEGHRLAGDDAAQ